MYRSSRLRSTSNTNVITGLDMFQECAETVDCVALWTRTSSQVWTCFKYDPKIWKMKPFFHRFGHVSHLWQRQKHCAQWDECSVWVLGRACCRNHMKRCLICTKTSVYYGEHMTKNARDQGPGRNNVALVSLQFSLRSTPTLLGKTSSHLGSLRSPLETTYYPNHSWLFLKNPRSS